MEATRPSATGWKLRRRSQKTIRNAGPPCGKAPCRACRECWVRIKDTSGTIDQPVAGVGHIPAVADNHPGHWGRLLVSGSVNQGATEPGSLRGDEPRPASLCGRLEASQPERWFGRRWLSRFCLRDWVLLSGAVLNRCGRGLARQPLPPRAWVTRLLWAFSPMFVYGRRVVFQGCSLENVAGEETRTSPTAAGLLQKSARDPLSRLA